MLALRHVGKYPAFGGLLAALEKIPNFEYR